MTCFVMSEWVISPALLNALLAKRDQREHRRVTPQGAGLGWDNVCLRGFGTCRAAAHFAAFHMNEFLGDDEDRGNPRRQLARHS